LAGRNYLNGFNMDFIEFNQVKIMYDTYTVVEDFTLSIKKGEIISLFGPSGSGKTTLFKALLGLINPVNGSININGFPVQNYRFPIAYVPQFNDLLPWLTVEKNILLSYLESSKSGSNLKCLSPEESTQIVDLKNANSKLPKELSGGMTKRTALARCLSTHAEIMLLDEAFVSVEKTLKDHLMVEIRAFIRAQNMTCIIVSHDLSELTYMSDRVIHISSSPATVIKEARNTLPEDRSDIDFNSLTFSAATSSLIIAPISSPVGSRYPKPIFLRVAEFIDNAKILKEKDNPISLTQALSEIEKAKKLALECNYPENLLYGIRKLKIEIHCLLKDEFSAKNEISEIKNQNQNEKNTNLVEIRNEWVGSLSSLIDSLKQS
jgi:ABC-type nitrate/sulfonate/bicarbonate transport system ATPase subunit